MQDAHKERSGIHTKEGMALCVKQHQGWIHITQIWLSNWQISPFVAAFCKNDDVLHDEQRLQILLTHSTHTSQLPYLSDTSDRKMVVPDRYASREPRRVSSECCVCVHVMIVHAVTVFVYGISSICDRLVCVYLCLCNHEVCEVMLA